MTDFLFWFLCGFSLSWIAMSLRRNPPPPSRKPAPPVGPPEQPLAAQLIRYWAWEQEQIRRAAAGQSSIRFDEGQTQRGNGNGGPSTAQPPIKPEPQGGHLIQEGRLWGGYQPRPQGGTPNPPPEAP